jgi:type II secretory pathway pseudopilin PulG
MKINTLKKNTIYNSGFSLVEMIMYIGILSIITTAIVLIATTLLGTFSQLKAYEDITRSSTLTLERISRELRRAESVDIAGSTLHSNPGSLVLHTTTLAGVPSTVTIYVSGGRVMIQENSDTPSPLTSLGVVISTITFTHTIGTNTEGVLIELTAEKITGGTTVVKQFRTFVVLDGS